MTPDIRTMPCTAGGFSDVGFIKAFRTAFKLSLDRAEDCPQEPLISKEDINKAISQVFESKGFGHMLDWGEIEAHLQACEKKYAGEVYAHLYVLQPLRDRYNKGERTLALRDEIKGVKL